MHASATHIQVHEPKTGGTWLSRATEALAGAARWKPQHLPVWMLGEDEIGGREIVGTVRDPWTKYISLYRHALASNLHRVSLASWFGSSAVCCSSHSSNSSASPPHCGDYAAGVKIRYTARAVDASGGFISCSR